MAPAAVVVAVGGVFTVLGLLTGRELATRGYRIAEDEPTGLPHSHWWTGPLAGLLAGYLSWRIGGLAHWSALPAYLLLAWLAGPLIWIDRDVHRLPIGLVQPAGVAVAVLLAVASVADGTDRWRGALIGAAAAFAIYGVLWLLPGGIGYGDVRLAPVLGALLGWLGIGALVVGLAAGFVLGGLQALILLATGRAGPKTRFAFGPAMLLGTVLAIGETSRIAALLVGG